jgi:hypothetical protein
MKQSEVETQSNRADGLFVGQTPKFFQVVQRLAEEADAAERE